MLRTVQADDIELARWISKFNERAGYSPSIQEICDAFGWASKSTGHARLNSAIQKGLVTVETPQRRRLVVKEGL